MNSKCISGSTSVFVRVPFLVGLPGSEAVSLISDMLELGLRAFPLLPLPLCWNLTSFRGRAMVRHSVPLGGECSKLFLSGNSIPLRPWVLEDAAGSGRQGSLKGGV